MRRRKIGKNLSIGGNHGLVLAWHWHWSRTWRWAIWFSRPHSPTFGIGRFVTYMGQGSRAWVRTPWLSIHFVKQPNQPYGECW